MRAEQIQSEEQKTGSLLLTKGLRLGDGPLFDLLHVKRTRRRSSRSPGIAATASCSSGRVGAASADDAEEGTGSGGGSMPATARRGGDQRLRT